jgi:Fe-S cluster assembly protein SufD
MTEVAERNTVLESLNNRFAKLDHTSSFHSQRALALEKVNTIGLPHAKNEEYKYTNITKVLDKGFDLNNSSAESHINAQVINDLNFEGLDSYKLVFINGVFSKEFSDLPKSTGISIQNIAAAIDSNDQDFLNDFGKASKNNSDPFLALNTSLVEDGAYIKVADNVVVDKPISLYFINEAGIENNYATFRNLVTVGKSSQVDFLEVFTSTGAKNSFTNVVSELIIGENANVNYYKIQNNKDSASHIGTTQVYQSRSSVFSAYTFTLNGGTIRNNLNITIDGEGCESHMNGLYVVNGKTHVDNHTVADHIQPHCDSNELYKGILEDQSRAVFNGKVFVRKEAQKTNAFQSNKNILLSDSSIVNTKPQLEIWADDVKCSHGCTTGQLDEDAMFYLRARGLSKTSARAMLLYAFAIEVIESVKLEPLKNYLEEIISERLHQEF